MDTNDRPSNEREETKQRKNASWDKTQRPGKSALSGTQGYNDPRQEISHQRIQAKKASRRKKLMAAYVIIGILLVAAAAGVVWLIARAVKDGNNGEATTASSTEAVTLQATTLPKATTATTEKKTEAVTEEPKPVEREAHVTLIEGLPFIDEYLGCKGLYSWMLDHFNDYYFKTPYIGIWEHVEHPEELMQPYGEYGENGGMNCSGFISHLLMSAGGDLEKVSEMGMEAKFGDADSYLYLALRDKVQYEAFDSVDDLLKSGKARKGDLLYLYPVKDPNAGENDPKPDCHMGVFWGETSSENKMWSASRDSGCTTTEIKMINDIAKVYLIPVNGN